MTGSEMLAQALKRQGVRDFFYLMGGPMLPAESSCLELGLRGIDPLALPGFFPMIDRAQKRERRAPPGVLIVFGASGDLTSRKLMPALEQLSRRGLLPAAFSVVGIMLAEQTLMNAAVLITNANSGRALAAWGAVGALPRRPPCGDALLV